MKDSRVLTIPLYVGVDSTICWGIEERHGGRDAEYLSFSCFSLLFVQIRKADSCAMKIRRSGAKSQVKF